MIISGVVLLSSGFLLVGLAVVAGELRKVANLLDPRGPKDASRSPAATRRGRAPANPSPTATAPGGFPGYPAPAESAPAGSGAQPSGPSAATDAEWVSDDTVVPRPPFTSEPIPEPRMSFDAAWPNPAGSPAQAAQNPPDAAANAATGAPQTSPSRSAVSSPATPSQPPRRSDIFRRNARASSLTEHPPGDEASRSKASAVDKPAPPPPPPPPPVAVSILKSGVVDGMAYTLYSDGSIEAELAEGKVRFASIEALRSHLDQRGA